MPAKHVLQFTSVTGPITTPTTKFGGQPVWVDQPQWPLSRETGKPMQFICQIALSELGLHTSATMAYLFMTDGDDGEFVDGTYEADGGENAIILQPGVPTVPTSDVREGPSLYRMVSKPGEDRLQPEPCEFAVDLVSQVDIEFMPEEERWQLPEDQRGAVTGELEESKIGGTPVFMQGDEFPFDDGWQLLLQLDSCGVPFYINFGDAGVGYGFLNKSGDQAKFLWQCA